MSQTIQNIEDELDTIQASKTELSGLNSPSNIADFKLWKSLFAQASLSLQSLWDNFQASLETVLQNNQYGDLGWWQQQILLFQYGDALTVINGKLGYDIIDPTKQIITRCAAIEFNSIVILKVAKQNPPIPLSSTEKTALTFYVDDIKPAGVKTQIVLSNPDQVKWNANIYYNGLIVLADFQTAIEAAMNAYILSIPFNGNFNINKLREAIFAVPGVIDVDIQGVFIKQDGGSYVTVTREYVPYSGYYIYNTVSGTPPDQSTINYFAQ